MGIESVLYIHMMKKYFIVYCHVHASGKIIWENGSIDLDGEITLEVIKATSRLISQDRNIQGVVVTSIVSFDSINGR